MEKRGKSKITLTAVFAGALIFAWFVQRSKQVELQIKLTKDVDIVIPAGEISFKIPSSWHELEGWDNKNIITQWGISIGNTRIGSCVLFEMPALQSIPELTSLVVVDAIFPIDAFKLSSIHKPRSVGNGVIAQLVDGVILRRGRIEALKIESLILPNNTAVVFVSVSSVRFEDIIEESLDGIVETIRYKPADNIKKISSGKIVENRGVRVKFSEPVWVMKDKIFPLMSVRSAKKDDGIDWFGTIKFGFAPKWQDAKGVIKSYFLNLYEPQKDVGVGHKKVGKFEVFWGRDEGSVNVGSQKLRYVDKVWFVVDKKGECGVLIGLSMKENCENRVNLIVDYIIKNIGYSFRKPRPVYLKELLTKPEFLDCISRTNGWFEMRVFGKLCGVSSTLMGVKDDNIVAAGFLSSKRSFVEYTKYEYSEADVGGEGNYLSRMRVKKFARDKIESYSVVSKMQAVGDKVELMMRIKGKTRFKNIELREYVLPSLFEAVVCYVAKNASVSEEFYVGNPEELLPEFESVVIKKVEPYKVAVAFGSETIYGVYKFDENYRISRVEITRGVSFRREDVKVLARKYPVEVRDAVDFYNRVFKE